MLQYAIKNKCTRIVAAAILAVAILAASPLGAFAEALAADPDSSRAASASEQADEGVRALKDEVAALKRIIELNVPKAEKIPVLLYHHLARAEDMADGKAANDMVMSIEQFTEQMKWLYDNRYYAASVEELEQWKAGKMPLPQKTVVVTFDDGYRSNTKYAYPVLKKYGFSASIFHITSMIGQKENVIEHASWADLKKCKDVFTNFSHSHNMHTLSRDGKSALVTRDADDIAMDLLVSKALLGTSFLAYPYGQFNRTTKKLAEEAGFRMAFTTEAQYATRKSDAFEVPRFTVTPNITLEAFASLCSGETGASAGGAEGGATDGEPAAAAAPAA
jgi:peptidoglycan/xylan/chitin deacetylase (PgdA/CDA1 family)